MANIIEFPKEIVRLIANFGINLDKSVDILNILRIVCKDLDEFIDTLCIYIYRSMIYQDLIYYCSTELNIMKDYYCVIYMKNHQSTLEHHTIGEEEFNILAESINYDLNKLRNQEDEINISKSIYEADTKYIKLYTKYEFKISEIINTYSYLKEVNYKGLTIFDMIIKVFGSLFKYCVINKSKNIVPKLIKEKYIVGDNFFEILLEHKINN
jgi:hypothetical protein